MLFFRRGCFLAFSIFSTLFEKTSNDVGKSREVHYVRVILVERYLLSVWIPYYRFEWIKKRCDCNRHCSQDRKPKNVCSQRLNVGKVMSILGFFSLGAKGLRCSEMLHAPMTIPASRYTNVLAIFVASNLLLSPLC